MKYTATIMAAATSVAAANTNEERNLGWGSWGVPPPPEFYFTPHWGSSSSKSSKRSDGKSSKGSSSWGSGGKSGKGSGKSGKGSSKSSKGSSSKEQKFKWVWVPYEPEYDDWSDESSSGKSGKGSYGGGSAKSGKGSYGDSHGSGKSGKGSYVDDSYSGGSSGKSGKGSYSSSDDGDDWAGGSSGGGSSGKSGKGSYGGGSSGKSGKGSYSSSDDGDDLAGDDKWAGDDYSSPVVESDDGDDNNWGGSEDDDHLANGWETDGHTGYYKPNPDGSVGWAHDGHVPGTYDEYVQGDFEDGNGYSEHAYNHVTDLCYASCDGDVCTYHMKVDLFASEFGAITFEECEDIGAFPTITMELGKTYKFVQSDISNYMHPIGFGYYPDAGPNEIDAANAPPGADSSCADYQSCPEVDYMLNDKSISLDDYEAQFAHPLEEFVSAGTYSAEFNFPEGTGYSDDLFYWCHIHSLMGGRVKLLSGGDIINERNYPPHLIYFSPPGEYDVECGTYGLEPWQLPNAECPHRFVCNVDEVQDSALSTFAGCLESMNCHMFAGMTTHATQGDIPLFIHQMIPHHQNAVNMAKSLLKHWSEKCSDLSGADESDDCVMEIILRSIVNAQNAQIQIMRDILAAESWTEFDDCPVKIGNTFEDMMEHGSAGSNYEHNYSNDSSNEGMASSDDATWSDHGHRALSSNDGICKISCDSDTCDIYVEVDLFETVLGAFKFDQCGDEPYPTIGLEVGKTYRFIQKNINNYYHPLGFAYFADGAHADKEELSEDDYLSYKIDDKHVGLDGYEPKFFHSPTEWATYGTFNVDLTVPEDHGEDIFYFCHIHEFMSGRIKLTKNGEVINYENVPEIPYKQEYQSSSFDKECGTMHLGDFQLPHPECPHKFICDGNSVSTFATCLEAMNCAMMVGMTTYVEDQNDGDVALFNHQMIPHHENAVNMAKTMLKNGGLSCDDITGDSTDCQMLRIMYEIVNNQNFQIQSMRKILADDGFSEFNDCKVNINSKDRYSFLRA